MYLFEQVPLELTGTTVTARAAGCPDGTRQLPSDTAVFTKVNAPVSGYIKPEEPDEQESEGVKNWFDDLPVPGQSQTLSFADGFYSVRDTLSALMADSRTDRILTDALSKFSGRKIKKSMLGIMGSASLENVIQMFSPDKTGTEKLLCLINGELQKIPKE